MRSPPPVQIPRDCRWRFYPSSGRRTKRNGPLRRRTAGQLGLLSKRVTLCCRGQSFRVLAGRWIMRRPFRLVPAIALFIVVAAPMLCVYGSPPDKEIKALEGVWVMRAMEVDGGKI